LRDIAEALDMDYEATKSSLLKAYYECQKYLPPEWQDIPDVPDTAEKRI
jgi:hypothetical protein